MFEARYYVYNDSKVLYHTILFISFVISFKIFPFIQVNVFKYVENNMLQFILPLLVAYIAAMYIIPEIGFMLIRSTSD